MIRLDVTPIGKPRMTHRDKWKQRPCVVKYYLFKDTLRAAARRANFTLGQAIRVEFHIPMPESWSKKRKLAMTDQPHQSRPDLDNCEKSLLDCLAPKDDAHIWRIDARKVWSEEGFILIENIE